jgi:hypothetical protein
MEGANALFSGTSIKLINRTFESIYVNSHRNFEDIFEESKDKESELIKNDNIM